MKTPLMKMSGNFRSDESIMMFDGTFVAGVERRSPSAEKQIEARMIPAASPR
jgi:hypothetical protein